MRFASWLHRSFVLVFASQQTLHVQSNKHEVGRCVMRGQCGRESFFSPELPCPDNDLARLPDDSLRSTLVDICGADYASGAVCCDAAQVAALRDSLKKAENLIASCPACKANFFDFFCAFTCSPNQSTFLNVTETTAMPNGQTAVTGLQHIVDKTYSSGFYRSCQFVKFSATNGYVMDLIGGGAQDPQGFLEFLGHKSLLGSPIQIDYPDAALKPGLIAWNPSFKSCDDPDARYRCACVDCPSSCPTLPAVDPPSLACKIGIMPCLSFSALFLYITGLAAFTLGYSLQLRKSRSSQVYGANQLQFDDGQGDVPSVSDCEQSGSHEISTYWVNDWLEAKFYDLGLLCASFPYASIGISLLTVVLLSFGWSRFSIETDPVKLWVSPSATVAQQRDYFDATFGPFYRAQQIFLSNASDDTASVLSYHNLEFLFNLENEISSFRSADALQLQDFCLKPTGDACVVQSVTGYWQGQLDQLESATWNEDLKRCADQPVQCLPLFQQPLKPAMIFGGYRENDWLSAKALISTFVLRNSLNPDYVEKAISWETELLRILQKAQVTAQSQGLRLTFSTEASLEAELNKSSNTDATIVLISYLAMFLYVSVALGSSRWRGKQTFVHTKFSIGLFGILIVLMSISASVGLFSMLGIKVTLIIAEVIPFLVLAVGVDNIFLLCHELDRVTLHQPELSGAEQIALTTSKIGPSILLSATSETVAFAIGAAVSMPAVRNFAIYAAGAVFFDAILQLTMFTAALALDQRRMAARRVDCIPILRIQSDMDAEESSEGPVSRFMRYTFTPYLMRSYVKAAVVCLFGSWAVLSLALLPEIDYGLDQKIALPSDSYLVNYFLDLEQYFGVGPPVYFVAKAPAVTKHEVQQAICGRFTSCNELSIANILEQERKRPEVSFLLEPAASWLDDFFYWLNPQLEMCCRVYEDDESKICDADTPGTLCNPCFSSRQPPWNVNLTGMPEGAEFMWYLAPWLEATSNEDCPLAGKAPYGDAVIINSDGSGLEAFNVRTFHTPLRTQSDLINSYIAGERIARELSDKTGLDIFAYAIHYVFFAQYQTILRLTLSLLAAALVATFLIAATMLGSVTAAALMSVTVGLIVLNVAGSMALFNISLNALSLVNLVVCVGIGVEFTAHIIRAYMLPSSDFVNRVLQEQDFRESRSRNALANVGASVFSGITLCKFCGVVVLAFTQSKIFDVYYFRMWLSLVLIAATHGLILLPVLLSLFGPRGFMSRAVDSATMH